MGKGDFQFAAANRVPALLAEMDRNYLSRWTPCTELTDDELIHAIAVVHVEFILVHPFREGNGRISRLLADVMSTQAGYGTLDYSAWDRSRDEYFLAIQKGLMGDYVSMEFLVAQAFSESWEN